MYQYKMSAEHKSWPLELVLSDTVVTDQADVCLLYEVDLVV